MVSSPRQARLRSPFLFREGQSQMNVRTLDMLQPGKVANSDFCKSIDLDRWGLDVRETL
jgi:hypothetical protein